MIQTKPFETRSSIIEKLDQDILRIARKEGVEMKIEDLHEISAAYTTLLEKNRGKFLVILDDECTSEVGFMEKMADKERKTVKKAEALIVSSLGKRLEANFYIRKFKPEHAIAVFSNEQEGLNWLRTIE